MKKLIIAAFLLFYSLTAKAQIGEMFIESESKYSFNETVKILTETITTGGWKILVVHDLQESMKKSGKEVLPVKVFELCNPKHSYKILSVDELRIYSSLMPCRFSVYESSGGKVYISRMNTVMLSKQIGGIVETVMTDATKDTEEFLKTVLY
jgi:uncharacterized protein (DUF302 family)